MEGMETVKNAGVAQLVEQRIRNAWVGGSIPSAGTIFPTIISQSGICSKKGALTPFPMLKPVVEKKAELLAVERRVESGA